MYVSELRPPEGAVDFFNSRATGYPEAQERAATVHDVFGVAENQAVPITDPADPVHIQKNVQGLTLVYSDGGDGTSRRVMAAIIGDIQDNPEASARNLELHSQLAHEVLFVAGAGGNANLFARSALGAAADQPELLRTASNLRVGKHRPLLFEITNEQRDTEHSGVIISCFGLGMAAIVASALEEQKPAFVHMGKQRRLTHEIAVTGQKMLTAPAFSAELRIGKGKDAMHERVERATGIEIIATPLYAKVGKAPVTIDGTARQLVVAKAGLPGIGRLMQMITTGYQLQTGHYKQKPHDFRDSAVRVDIGGDQPVPFHIDGDISKRYAILPGQTLKLRLANIAVPVLTQR